MEGRRLCGGAACGSIELHRARVTIADAGRDALARGRFWKEMPMLARLIMVAGVLFAALISSSANADRRVALVVGNSAYKHAAMLRNPGNDANDVAAILTKLGFDVLVGLDLDQQGFARTIEQFARTLNVADVALFF